MISLPLVVLLGRIGSGKTTCGRLMSQQYGFQYLSSGELLRRELKSQTMAATLREEQILTGNFASDQVILSLLSRPLSLVGFPGAVLDGFPRTLLQARWLAEFVSINYEYELYPIFLNASQAVCNKRLRLSAQTLSGRVVDDNSFLRVSHRVYRQQTEPIVHFWKNQCLVIDANRPLTQVYERTVFLLKERGVI